MGNLLSLKMWFNIRPGALLPVFEKSLIGVIVIFIVLAIIFSLRYKKEKGANRKIWQRLKVLCITNVFLGFVLYFFTTQLIPVLSARFWFLIWGIEILVWLYFIYKMAREIPKKQEEYKKEREFKKYIP